jgi:hypothetical protein
MYNFSCVLHGSILLYVYTASFIYILCSVGNRTEQHCGNSAFICHGIDISPLVETLNFLWGRKEVVSIVILLVKHSSLHNLYKKYQGPMMSKAFALCVRQGRM